LFVNIASALEILSQFVYGSSSC